MNIVELGNMNVRFLPRENWGLGETALSTVSISDDRCCSVWAGWCEDELCALMLGEDGKSALEDFSRRNRFKTEDGGEIFLKKTRAALDAFTAGEHGCFPKMLLLGTAFQISVWRFLARIPRGETVSYKDVADELGTKACRAVGSAVGANPISLLIPCHRVVGSRGGLGGYAWGLPMKRMLLLREGVQIC